MRAKERGARILAEIVGYGVSNDAVHLSHPEVEGQVRAIRMALDEAQTHQVTVADIGYVSAHGTATTIGDKVETESLRTAFGRDAYRLPISSTKALHGHLMGASGVVEFIAALTAMQREIAPPTAHLHIPDPECDLDYTALVARPIPGIRAVMSNSFSFGGTNAVLIARAPD